MFKHFIYLTIVSALVACSSTPNTEPTLPSSSPEPSPTAEQSSSPMPEPTPEASPTPSPTPEPTPTPKDPVAEFEKIVQNFEVHFASEPLYIDKVSEGNKYYFFAVKYSSSSGLKYDVKKTDSIINPLNATIEMDILSLANFDCGDTTWDRTGVFSNATLALKSNCFEAVGDSRKNKFTFIYQNNSWVLDSVVLDDGKESFFEKVFEDASPNVSYDPDHIEDKTKITKVIKADGEEAFVNNQKWLEILNP